MRQTKQYPFYIYVFFRTNFKFLHYFLCHSLFPIYISTKQTFPKQPRKLHIQKSPQMGPLWFFNSLIMLLFRVRSSLSLSLFFFNKIWHLAKRVVEIEGVRGCAWTWLAPQVMEVILLILLQLPNIYIYIYIYIYIWVEFWTLEYGILSSSHFPTQCFNFFFENVGWGRTSRETS